MEASLVVTVYNEEKTIVRFLNSIFLQTKLCDEVIIVDGGSRDKTLDLLLKYSKNIGKKLVILQKKGNRSVGRNEGIRKARGQIILLSDAGCVLDKNWVKEISSPFRDSKVDIVAGYYMGVAENIFQKSLIPYVLVMEDKVDKNNFLPATRSMALRKSVWQKLNGFDEILSHNEDFAFANKMENSGFKIFFAQNAIVKWFPRKNIKETFTMFFRFAFGDAEANIFRDKVILIFARYIFYLYLAAITFIMKSLVLLSILIGFPLVYVIWAILKNYKYVNDKKAFIYLPLFQFVSDFAILGGTTLGFLKSLSLKSAIRLILKNKGVTLVIVSYVLLMLSVISYGVPNQNHPFNYFMDEWHQSQSVRDLFKYGSPNTLGAANGSLFQFFLTGLYLIPFQLLHIVNVFAIKSSVTNLELQQRLFEVLRLNTLIFGILSIIVFSYIAKKFFKVNTFLAAFLFTFNPVWLMLSNYYKYDIALVFWILMSFLYFLKYSHKPTLINFFMGGVFTGIALSTKLLTPIPLFITYILIFFLYTPNFKKKLKYLLFGCTSSLLVYLFFGNPDIILGKGNILGYLYSNVISSPLLTENFKLGTNVWTYLTFKLYPVLFGRVLYYSFILSLAISLLTIFKFIKGLTKKANNMQLARIFLDKYKSEIITSILFLIFAVSLVEVGIWATNNRVLVLLPFMVLGSALLFKKVWGSVNTNLVKNIFVVFLLILFIFQFLESLVWFPIKWSADPRETSSAWIIKNIPKGSTIGLENIVIYQSPPNIAEKEFYEKQYGLKENYIYNYQVVGVDTKTFPEVIVISNDQIEKSYLKASPKISLLGKINNQDYKRIARFTPDFTFYKTINGEFEYYISGLVQAPNSISIYKRTHEVNQSL